MDEEEILRSSLEQTKKIDINNFFGSPIGGLANRAVLQSNTSLKVSSSNLNLIRALQTSLESLRSEIQQITNYILVDKKERGKILRQRELEEFEREDDIQKGLVRPESAQPRGLDDSLPFFPEARFSEGLTAGMSSIGERQGVAQFQERFVEGSRPFFFGGLVPGSGNADTVNAKLTPGEFVVPKNTVENLNPNFFKGLISSGKKNKNVESNDNFTNDSFNLNTSIKYSTRGNPKTGEIEVDPNSLEYPFMLEAANQQFYQDKVEELESKIFDSKLEAKVGGYKPNISHLEKELNMYKGKYDDTLEYGTRYGVGGNKDNKEDDKEGGFFKNLFGGKKNESVKSDDKKGRDLFGIMGGTIDAATGNLTDFDKRGGKPFGLMRGITGTIDAATGGLTDLDRRGGKPFGLMRGITGSIDAMTGGLTDLDRRGGKPFGLMRGITGIADAMTGDKFDFDRRGKGEEMTEGFSTYPIDEGEGKQRFITRNYEELLNNSLKRKEEYEESGDTKRIEGVKRKINFYKNKLASGVTEEKIPVTVKPKETTSSTDIKPKETLGEKFRNIFKGKEMKEGFSTYPSNISSDDSIKTAAQGIMQPPQGSGQSETIELPPQIQGDAGGGSNIAASPPSFKPSTPSHTGLFPTKSPIPFIDVISNQYLSVV